MSVQRSSWFSDLKYGNIFNRLQNIAYIVRLFIAVLAFELLAIGIAVTSVAHMFRYQAGYCLKEIFLGKSSMADAERIWADAWTLETLNLDESLDLVIESLTNGFSIVLVTGLIALLAVLSRANAVEYTAVLFLLIAMGLQSRDFKRFDNVQTPVQNKTMTNLRKAVIGNQLSLGDDFVSAFDFLMVHGGCCGIISGADMSHFKDDQGRLYIERRPGKKDKKTKGIASRLISPCWGAQDDVTQTTGCYVYYFEATIKPVVRSLFGLAFIAQAFLVSLILIQSQIPASKQDALRVVFYDRMPTPFPID